MAEFLLSVDLVESGIELGEIHERQPLGWGSEDDSDTLELLKDALESQRVLEDESDTLGLLKHALESRGRY